MKKNKNSPLATQSSQTELKGLVIQKYNSVCYFLFPTFANVIGANHQKIKNIFLLRYLKLR